MSRKVTIDPNEAEQMAFTICLNLVTICVIRRKNVPKRGTMKPVGLRLDPTQLENPDKFSSNAISGMRFD